MNSFIFSTCIIVLFIEIWLLIGVITTPNLKRTGNIFKVSVAVIIEIIFTVLVYNGYSDTIFLIVVFVNNAGFLLFIIETIAKVLNRR